MWQALLLALMVTGCCSEAGLPPPPHPSVQAPPQLPTHEADLLDAWADPTRWVYHPSRKEPATVTLPFADFRLLLEDRANGWANYRALRVAAGIDPPPAPTGPPDPPAGDGR